MRSTAGRELRNLIDTNWRPELAYAVGLIASDGWLSKDVAEIGIVSKDRELIETFVKCLKLSRKPFPSGRGGEVVKKYWSIRFKSRQFYQFLTEIGIGPAKSKTIERVAVPDEYFADFLRGFYDGDGTFWTEWDTRWKRSFVYHLGISSASTVFIYWLKERLSELYGVKGYVVQGDGVQTIRYAKGDTRALFNTMYYQKALPFLERKHEKIKQALDFDRQLKEDRSHAAVAQW